MTVCPLACYKPMYQITQHSGNFELNNIENQCHSK
uniref:Uncharacterized protein n=1 Tax=Arundo donax TaxID=35708 RepID=A0A0A9AKF9_ARUDO